MKNIAQFFVDRPIMAAVLSLGAVGYGVAMTFLQFGAPDLAMTQFSVETLTVLIYVLVFRKFRSLGAHSPRLVRYRDAVIAGGPLRTAGMLIAPCGPDTVGAIVHSLATSLIARAADATLQEGRRLVVVAREAPLHLGHLRALLALAEMGAAILPPLPAFYPRPRTIDDVVDHTVGRALDQLGVPHALVQEWTGTARARRPSPPRTGG